MINAPNQTGQYTTNWGTKNEDLFRILAGLSGSGAVQDYNNNIDLGLRNNQLLGGQYQNKTMEDFISNPVGLQGYFDAMDSIRRQMGLPTRNEILMGSAPDRQSLPQAAFAGMGALSSNAPYSPTSMPLEGFGWDYLDPDGTQGNAPARWMQSLLPGTSMTQDLANQLMTRMNQAGSPYMFNIPTGNTSPFSFNQQNGQYGVNTGYFAPAPPPAANTNTNNGGDWLTRLLSGLSGGGGGQQQPYPVQYQGGGGSNYSVGNSAPQTQTQAPAAPANLWNTSFNPNRTSSASNFPSFNYWGFSQGGNK